MPPWLKQIIHSPLIQPHDPERISVFLRAVFIFGIPATGLGIIYSLISRHQNPLPNLFIFSGILIVLLVSAVFAHRGHTLLSSFVLVFSVGAILTFISGAYTSARSLFFSSYLVIILLANQLFGWKIGLITFILSTVSGAAIVYSLIPNPLEIEPYTPTPLGVWLTQLFIFVWVMYLVIIERRSFNQALRQTQLARTDLLKSREDQQNAHTSLQAYAKDLERRIVQLQVAAEVARDSTTLQEVDALLKRAVDLVRQRFGFYHAGIFMLDERQEYAVLKSASGEAGQKMLAAGHKLKVGEVGIVGYVTGTGKPRIALDVGSDAVYFRNPNLPETRSELALPLITGGTIIGALDVQSKASAAFDEDDISILQTMADQLAVAISNARLYTEAQNRTQQLSEALALREELDRMKSEFIQNVSHELRTPLAIANGYVELLLNNELGNLTKEQQDATHILSRRINLLIKLVDDLVVILEAEARNQANDVIILNDLIRDCIFNFRDPIEQAGLTLESQIDHSSVIVMGDYIHLCRMVDNLLGNALKFTPTGGKITIKLYHTPTDAIIEVIDTGIGIAPDKIGHIFERFYQVDGTTKRRFGGIGLGLTLVKETIDAHNGTLTVHSELDKGSSFVIALPLKL